MDEAITVDLVRTAYWLYLGRAPENDAVVAHCLTFGTLAALRDAFLNTPEFEELFAARLRLVAADAPELTVDWQIDAAAAVTMLDRTRSGWTARAPQPAGASAARAAAILASLRRNGVDPQPLRRAFVFGDRGLRAALAAGFAELDGADIGDCADLRFGLHAPCDLWCGFDVLHLLPPPLIAGALGHALRQLRPGGAAVFQLPVYGYGYHYDAVAPAARLGSPARHLLPQPAVFSVIRAAGCHALEAFEELAAPPSLLWRAMTYVVRKPVADPTP